MEQDERRVELECIAAIFPEMSFDTDDSFTASIQLPVKPRVPVKVIFPASSDGALPVPLPPAIGDAVENARIAAPADIIESHNLSYLPSLQLRIILPSGYPTECAPKFELLSTPTWLSRARLDELQAIGKQMWEEAGHDLIVYGYIDFLQQEAENAFGFAAEGEIVEFSQDLKISLLDYDIKAAQAAFEKETFDCGVCLDPKKGTVCHQMLDCGHVFCVQCLQDFYSNAISEGDLATVRCLAPDCAKKRAEGQTATKKKLKTTLSPSELLQIPIPSEIVTRYVMLKHKADLESDKNTVYCPRKWCQGAARSKKHKKPQGLEDTDRSDDEIDDEEKPGIFRAGRDLLAVCEDCTFAFCSRCYQGWHGEFTICAPKTTTGELTEEDKASLEYMKQHTTPCPTCASPAQKTHGCNHMICFKCRSHFCYLCSAWLMPSNPYKHYNEEGAPCHMRLWEQEEGDGEGFDREARDEILELEQIDVADLPVPEVVEPLVEVPEALAVPPVPQAPLQREGPLVLRINQIPVEPVRAPAVPDPPVRGRRYRGPQNAVPQNVRQPGGRRQRNAARQRNQGPGVDVIRDPADQEAAHQAWVQMFVQMALNDEEDQLEWNSEDEEDAEAWVIPAR